MQSKKVEIIDLGDRVHNIIYKTTKQINDPQKIDKRILKDFVGKDRTEKVILLKGNQSCEGDLITPYSYSMGVRLLNKDFKLERNDTILVQFKYPTYDQNFVIQAVVKKVYPTWVTMECQDPRYDRRYSFRLQEKIEIFELPQAFYDLIKQKKVHIIRETANQTISEGKQAHRYIENIYSRIDLKDSDLTQLSLEPQQFHPEYKRVLAMTSIRGEFRDISQGGVCILLDDTLYDKRNLLLVRFNTPLVKNVDPALSCDALTFHLLGSMRNFSTIGRKHSLHMEFLKRLEDEYLDGALSKLERYYKLIRKPI